MCVIISTCELKHQQNGLEVVDTGKKLLIAVAKGAPGAPHVWSPNSLLETAHLPHHTVFNAGYKNSFHSGSTYPGPQAGQISILVQRNF